MKHPSKKFSNFDLELTLFPKYGAMLNMKICCYNTLSLTYKNCNFLKLLKNENRPRPQKPIICLVFSGGNKPFHYGVLIANFEQI